MASFDFTPEELQKMLRDVLPDNHIDLTEEHASGILTRIKQEHLTPVDSGHSLHCWNEDYVIDGGYYSVVGEIGNNSPPIVQLVQPRR